MVVKYETLVAATQTNDSGRPVHERLSGSRRVGEEQCGSVINETATWLRTKRKKGVESLYIRTKVFVFGAVPERNMGCCDMHVSGRSRTFDHALDSDLEKGTFLVRDLVAILTTLMPGRHRANGCV